jgi:hypothetical protein
VMYQKQQLTALLAKEESISNLFLFCVSEHKYRWQ